MGRLTKVIDPLLNETSYTYDSRGNKLTETDAEQNTTTWQYDEFGRVVKRILPLGQVETFTYNSDYRGQIVNYMF